MLATLCRAAQNCRVHGASRSFACTSHRLLHGRCRHASASSIILGRRCIAAAAAAGAELGAAGAAGTGRTAHLAAAILPPLPLPLLPVLRWAPLGLVPRCRVRMLRLQGSTLRVKREDRPSMAAEEGAICRQNKLR